MINVHNLGSLSILLFGYCFHPYLYYFPVCRLVSSFDYSFLVELFSLSGTSNDGDDDVVEFFIRLLA